MKLKDIEAFPFFVANKNNLEQLYGAWGTAVLQADLVAALCRILLLLDLLSNNIKLALAQTFLQSGKHISWCCLLQMLCRTWFLYDQLIRN